MFCLCNLVPNPALSFTSVLHLYHSLPLLSPPPQVYVTLVIQWAWYWLLAVYLSNVLPNEVCVVCACEG